jgi:hypothetical protein
MSNEQSKKQLLFLQPVKLEHETLDDELKRLMHVLKEHGISVTESKEIENDA